MVMSLEDGLNTDKIFNENSHILEINSKTGLYPLYVATSIYWKEFNKLNDQTAGKFGFEDELMIWQRILRENIFLVAKTPMAKEIARRTMAGYHDDWNINSEYVENIVEDSKADVNKEAKKIEGMFGNMKFDVVIGNPPYQQEVGGTRSSQRSIYHLFMKLGFNLADITTLITPARFLSDAGDTPANFNKEILNDPHFKVVLFEKNATKIFPHTDIKGGVAISLYDRNKKFEPIKLFIPFPELKSIYTKILPDITKVGNLTNIIYPANKFNLMNLYKIYPNDKNKISSNGKERRLQSNIFKLDAFHSHQRSNDIAICGVVKNKRIIKYIEQEVIDFNFKNNIRGYKVIIPKSNGSGTLGEQVSSPMLGSPMLGYTYTFIGIGNFKNKNDAENCMKYVKTKFARAMLGILKITQDNTPEKWRLVPLQDFTSSSDIDWTKRISEIDQQLYEKYGLSDNEIKFIESKVQAMS